MTSSSTKSIDLVEGLGSTSLLTREQGSLLSRRILEEVRNQEEAILIDLSSVEALSPSFVDELFGGLEGSLGAAGFKERIKIACPRTPWRRLISVVLAHRRTVRDTSQATISFLFVEGFLRPSDAERIRSELNQHLVVDQPQPTHLRSLDPLSYVQLLGAAAAWRVLLPAARVYFSTLAKHAADATWNGLASLFNSNEVRPLADVATTLADTAKHVDGKTKIIVGINIPDAADGTAISIESTCPEEVGRILASFIVHVEELSTAMLAEIEAGRAPVGQAIIELQDDGRLLVKFKKIADMEYRELRIPNSGRAGP